MHIFEIKINKKIILKNIDFRLQKPLKFVPAKQYYFNLPSNMSRDRAPNVFRKVTIQIAKGLIRFYLIGNVIC